MGLAGRRDDAVRERVRRRVVEPRLAHGRGGARPRRQGAASDALWPVISPAEIVGLMRGVRFFRDAEPWGFILFARNVSTIEGTRRLVDDLRSCVARADAPVLIDQEGGRVARLRPPTWRKAP